MNKELEEAVSRLKIIHDYKKQVYNMDKMEVEIISEFPDKDKKAIKTVLNYIDNSISKEVIEKKLNEIEDMIDKISKGELQKYTIGELIVYRKIYNELLEGK